MKISVCIKQVPDVDAPFRIRDGALVLDTDRTVLNAYDASAVEAALVLRETYADAVETIEVVTVGPPSVAETIRKALAMGADSGVHLETSDDKDYDARAYAELLARHFEGADADVILCGKQAQDTDAGLTGSMLAALLDLPYSTNAVGLDIEGGGGPVIVKRQGDQGTEVLALQTPCLITCSNDMNDPRIPKLKGIMQAKRKPVDITSAAERDDVGATRTVVDSYAPMPSRKAGEKLEGTAEEMVHELVGRLDTDNVL